MHVISATPSARVRTSGPPAAPLLAIASGTGVLARQFAKQGSVVTGIDIAPEQVEAASGLAAREGLTARFAVAAAEASGLPAAG